MEQRTRRAKFVATLVYYDGPQLVLLSAAKTRIIGMAVPSKNEDKFILVSVSQKDWELYLSEEVDLRYLFSFPKKRAIYYAEIKSFTEKVILNLFSDVIPADHLPDGGFFASEHTEVPAVQALSQGKELLKLAGQWELQDFGAFQQKYTDVYAFIAMLSHWIEGSLSETARAGVLKAFIGKPLRGGSSYGSLFAELERYIPQGEKIRLGKIQKASPGWMEMRGDNDHFDEVESFVEHYLENRGIIDETYRGLYNLLQEAGLLRMNVAEFDEGYEKKAKILEMSETLACSLGLDEFKTIQKLCHMNSLAVAKVILALKRRVAGASLFFAQGRVSYSIDNLVE